MGELTFHISGQVVERKRRTPLGGLLVEAWDSDLFCDDFVGRAITDVDGNFHIQFSQIYFRELFIDREPDLYFKIFKGGQLIASTEDSVLWNVHAGEREVEIEVDD